MIVVGLPKADAGGVFTALVDLGDEGSAYVAVSAFNRLGHPSGLSNERVYAADAADPLGKPGTPTLP